MVRVSEQLPGASRVSAMGAARIPAMGAVRLGAVSVSLSSRNMTTNGTITHTVQRGA